MFEQRLLTTLLLAIPNHRYVLQLSQSPDRCQVFVDGEGSEVCWSTSAQNELFQIHGEEGLDVFAANIVNQVAFWLALKAQPGRDWREISDEIRESSPPYNL